jgi:cytochrome P450
VEEHASLRPGCPAHETASDFDPWNLANPFEFYARARSDVPIFFNDELGYWVVSRYEDIQEVFKDPATFSSENTQAPYRKRSAEIQSVLDDAGFNYASGLSARQPPDHTRLRRFIQKAFTPRRVAALEPEVRSLAIGLIERMESAGNGDLVADLANHLPALVIFRLLGAPDVDVEQAKRWALSRVYLNFGDLPPGEQAEHAQSLAEYGRFCAGLVEASFEQPGDDLPGDLARIYLEGDDSLSKDEIVGLVYTQLFAGHETTTSLLGSGLMELLEQRDRWQDLCDDPALIGAAVEEMLRLAPAVFTWRRITTRPTRVGDTDLPAGANLLLLLGSANRDESVFAEPDRIDFQRENARSHLSFGHGIHFCLGASLARLEVQIVLEELTQRLPGLRLVDGQTFEYRRNTTFRGPVSVLVEWADAEPELVMALRDCRRDDLAIVGGKAVGLGSLLAAEFPVPAGFAVTTHAYSLALELLGGGAALEAVLATAGSDDDLGAVDLAAGRARSLVEQVVLPESVRAAIAEAYAALGDEVPVAVRSSATAEDSVDASFAGQQDSFLWIVGEAAVLDAVRRCWASLFSARSVSYRRARGIAEADVLMGVVVQAMVQADCAGVAMTLNPANGDPCIIAIESSYGLGETVVGGAVTPDRFLVDKVVLEIVETAIGDKHIELVPDLPAGGCSERAVPEARRHLPSLTHEQIRSVARLAKRVEQEFGSPQDIEWAIEGETVQLLQSRPETVWSRKPRPTGDNAVKYQTGLAGLVDTLVNPLAARSTTDVRTND